MRQHVEQDLGVRVGREVAPVLASQEISEFIVIRQVAVLVARVEHLTEGEAFERGREPAGVQCPNCGQYRLQAVRIDADANMVFGFIAFVVGAIALVLVVFGGDVGLYFTNASVLAAGLLIAGVLLLLLARYRRWPKAFECFSCGYRVP